MGAPLITVSDSSLCWLLGAIVLVALVIFKLFVSTRRERAHDASAMQTMAAELRALHASLAESRADARVAAETHRAQTMEVYAQQLSTIDKQLRDVMAQTGQRLDGGQQMTRDALDKFNQNLHAQLTAHRTVIADVQGQLGALGEAARGMQELGKDIASLQDILRAPKLRGNLGELLLGEILRQVLPEDAFALQHRFGDDELLIVDAIIRLGERVVPIDAKFPLEAFYRLLQERDAQELAPDAAKAKEQKARKAFLDVIKKHIESVAKKYIRPDLQTYDFAMVYIPAENVYYEAVVYGQAQNEGGLAAFAAERKVMLVSPSTLYAYLLTVLYGLRGMQIGAKAEHLRKDLASLHKTFGLFFQSLEKSERQIRLAEKQHEETMKRARKFNTQMGRVTGEALALSAAQSTEDEALQDNPHAEDDARL